ncbi:extensin family protein [Planktotalea arctica]|uniref:extensin-like domain-containing protein n=1 Tax=Planktotalea arctica TaxID=1481893 RepID=UPI000A174D4F|nr:extensin family protein [Planktotalea arctica]
MKKTEKRRRPIIRFAALFILVLFALLGSALLRHPDTPLPSRWNVFEPLVVSAPITPITAWKLDWASSDPKLCMQIMQRAGRLSEMEDLAVDENCGVTGRVTLRGVGQSTLDPLETSCATALRMAMWEHHGIQPAARNLLGSNVKTIRHIGSYNCRMIVGTQRFSTHSTADAIDIAGFDLVDGTRIRLLRDWGDDDAKARFLREVRNASCDWFAITLGPDYNAAHADHFHLQNEGRGTCR